MDPFLITYLKKTSTYQVLLNALNNEFIRGEFEGKQFEVQQKFIKLLEDHVYSCSKTVTVNFKGIDDQQSFFTQQVQGMLRFSGTNVSVDGVSIGALNLIATEDGGLIPEDEEDDSENESDKNTLVQYNSNQYNSRLESLEVLGLSINHFFKLLKNIL